MRTPCFSSPSQICVRQSVLCTHSVHLTGRCSLVTTVRMRATSPHAAALVVPQQTVSSGATSEPRTSRVRAAVGFSIHVGAPAAIEIAGLGVASHVCARVNTAARQVSSIRSPAPPSPSESTLASPSAPATALPAPTAPVKGSCSQCTHQSNLEVLCCACCAV